MAINLFVTIVVARQLGPTVFGDLNYLLAILAFIAPISALGLNSLITKEIIDRHDDEKVILGTSVFIRLIGAILSLILVLGLMVFTNISRGYSTELTILAVANLFTTLYVFEFFIQAKMINHFVVKMRLFVVIVSSILKLYFAFNFPVITYFVCIAVLELFLISIGFIYIYHSYSKNLFKLECNFREAKYLFSKSGWLILSGIAAVIYLKLDQIMLGHLSTSAELGYYAVAARLSEVWYFIPTAIVASFFPSLIESKHSIGYRFKLQKLNDFLFLSSISIAIITSLMSSYIVVLLYGHSYEKAGIILSIHIWAGIFIFMRALLSKWLINENLLKFSFISQTLGACTNIILNWLLIPKYGAIGAAYATVISYVAASYIALFFSRKTLLMASIITKSLLLPFRALIYRTSIYKNN